MSPKVTVLIPIYKAILDENELKSVLQSIKVFEKHSIKFLAPKNLNCQHLNRLFSELEIVRFEDKFFKSVISYSQLLLSPKFYRKFKSSEYILICQTDVWVFKDELDFWCTQDYDYIGAPWLTPPPITTGEPKINLQKFFINKVGNGGFSLRKVKSHFRNAVIFYPLLKLFNKNEDMFWGMFIDYLNPFFKKPHYLHALEFAIERDGREAMVILKDKLPMAVHAWEKYDLELWETLIN